MHPGLSIVSFVESIHDHGRLCNGNIIIRRNAVQLRRLTLNITVCYSEKKKCTVWELGTYKWSSSGKVVVPNRNRTAFVPDVLYSLACYMTPTTFVKSFTLSPYLEGLLSKYILYSKTSICESYFHWSGIMVPKWQNVTKGEYIMREAAAYIAFCKRQNDKSLFTKKLRQQKYTSTLVGTAGQKTADMNDASRSCTGYS